MLASPADLKRNIKNMARKMKECRETGNVYGFPDTSSRDTVRHLDSGDGGMHADGFVYRSCGNCGMTYVTAWTQEDWKAYREAMERVITI